MSQATIARANLPRPRRAPGAWERACELTFDLTLLALMAAAALGVIVLAAAEAEYYRDTPAAVRAAASIGDTRYRERLAELVALDNPLAANEVLREAARSDPRSASAWISLGLSEERLAEARLNVEKRLTEARLNVEERPTKARLNVEERLAEARLNMEERLTKARLNVEERLTKARLNVEERPTEARLNVEERPTEARLNVEERLAEARLNMEERLTGDFARAREAFESAFRVDRQYAPAWALANFCFRRGDQECFWRAASRAAAQAPALEEASTLGSPGSANLTDLRPLLDLASRMEPSPGVVLDRLGAKTNSPFAPAMERAYLDGLIGQSRWDDAMTVARRLAMRSPTHRDASDILRFDDLVTRLIAVGRASLGVGLWNDYAGYAVLNPERGLSLTNGDFSRAPRNAGFDWRIGSPAGDSARASPGDGIERRWAPSQLEFRFAGGEPEQAPLAEQWLPLGARSYRLRFEYGTRDMPSPTGVHWERAAEEASSLEPCPSAWCSAQWSFSAARETCTPLRLVYRREPATARARGSLLLRNVRLEAL